MKDIAVYVEDGWTIIQKLDADLFVVEKKKEIYWQGIAALVVCVIVLLIFFPGLGTLATIGATIFVLWQLIKSPDKKTVRLLWNRGLVDVLAESSNHRTCEVKIGENTYTNITVFNVKEDLIGRKFGHATIYDQSYPVFTPSQYSLKFIETSL